MFDRSKATGSPKWARGMMTEPSRERLTVTLPFGIAIDSELVAKFVRFVIVGLIVAGAYLAIYMACLHISLDRPVANTIAYASGVVIQCFSHGLFTFQVKSLHWRHLMRFIVMVVLGYLASILITSSLGPAGGWSDLLSAAFVVVVVPPMNFWLMLVWVFYTPQNSDDFEHDVRV